MVEDAGTALLSDVKFGTRATGQWVEEGSRVLPLRVDYLVELRDDAVLNMRVEPVELVGTRCMNFHVQSASLAIRVSVHQLDDLLT